MSKIKRGDYSLDTCVGEFDLFDLVNSRSELDYLSLIKKQLIEEKLHPIPKKDQICILSIVSFIIYMNEIEAMMPNEKKPEFLN